MIKKAIRFAGMACLLLAITTPVMGQILRVQGRHIPPENMGEVIKRETTYWAEVARKAIQDGHMSGWRMYRQIDGMALGEEPNVFFVNEFTPEQMRKNAKIWDHKKVFPDKEHEEMETFSMGTTKSLFYYYRLVGIGNPDAQIIRVNFAKTSGMEALRRYLELEQSVWQPFIEERMDSGKTNVVSWSLLRLMYPAGRNVEWDAISVDGFDSLADALMADFGDDAAFPDNEEIWEVHHKAVIHLYELVMAVGPEE